MNKNSETDEMSTNDHNNQDEQTNRNSEYDNNTNNNNDELHQFNFSINPSSSSVNNSSNSENSNINYDNNNTASNNDSYFKISVTNNRIKTITKLEPPDDQNDENQKSNLSDKLNINNNQNDSISTEIKSATNDVGDLIPSDSKRQKTNESTINNLNKSNLIETPMTNNENDSGSDVDLSDVKLYKPPTKNQSSKRKRNESSSNLDKSSEPTTSKRSNDINNNLETSNNEENGNEKEEEDSDKNDKKEVKTDASKPEYWDTIYNTKYFRENSLHFKDILNREFGYCGRPGHGGLNNIFSSKTYLSSNIHSNNSSNNNNDHEINKKPVLIYDNQLQTPIHFVNKAISSLNLLKKMKISKQLDYHDGCVNALHFNRIGTLLASGSDDYQVCIWDYARSNLVLSFDSGHKSNVFQVFHKL